MWKDAATRRSVFRPHKYRKLRLAISTVLALTPLRFAASQESARIYVYAPRETAIRSWLPVQCDGTPVAKIKRGNFFAINVAAGKHMLSGGKGVPLFVDSPAGSEAFVRLAWQVEIGEPQTLVFDNVPARVGRNELRFVVYIEPKQALSNSVPKTDPHPPPELQFKPRDDQ